MKVKVATWNVSECVSTEWKIGEEIDKAKGIENSKILNEMIEYINTHDIDIIGFQEFLCTLDEQEKVAELIVKKTNLKYYQTFGTAKTFLIEKGTAGVAIFSKYPIVGKKTRKYWNPKLEIHKPNGVTYYLFDKGIITSTIDLGEKKLDVINSHALAWGRFGVDAHDYPQSYKELDDAITESFNNTDNVIMMGDLNAYHIDDLIPNNYNKLTEMITGNKVAKGKSDGKIDYMMISDTIKKIGLEVLDNSSDHYVFVAEIEL